MNIQTATGYMKHGYRIRRSTWHSVEYLEIKDSRINKYYVAPPGCSYIYGYAGWSVQSEDLIADDWELITEGVTGHFPVTYSD